MVLQGEKYADPLSGGKAPSGTAQAHSALFHPKSGEYKLSAGNGTTGRYARRRRQAQKTGGLSQVSLTLAVQVVAEVVGLTNSRLPGMTKRLETFLEDHWSIDRRGYP